MSSGQPYPSEKMERPVSAGNGSYITDNAALNSPTTSSPTHHGDVHSPNMEITSSTSDVTKRPLNSGSSGDDVRSGSKYCKCLAFLQCFCMRVCVCMYIGVQCVFVCVQVSAFLPHDSFLYFQPLTCVRCAMMLPQVSIMVSGLVRDARLSSNVAYKVNTVKLYIFSLMLVLTMTICRKIINIK